MEKTNVMRILDQKKIPYIPYDYSHTGVVSGVDVAQTLGQDPDQVFKTLVTKGRNGSCYVFVVPVTMELNLKKAAAASGEKSIEMLKSKELLPLTGYIHGGCSPVGMKKLFRTYFDFRAAQHKTILVSAGKVGYQVEVEPDSLLKLVNGSYADLAE